MTDGTQLWTTINVSMTNYEGYKPFEVTVPEEWEDVDTDVPAYKYYVLCAKTDTEYEYQEIDKYDLPSYAEPVRVEEVPENPTADSDEFIELKYTIHIDLLTEAKFFYCAWDGKGWHKKVMKEGESVVLVNEDYPNPCDTAATPYVTEDNKNHEWRIFVNEETGLDELIDTLEALKKEFEKELDEIREAISGVTDDLANLSGYVETMYDEMVSGFTSAFTAIDDLQRQLDEEVSARTAADEELWAALDEETDARIEGDEELWEALGEEASARTAADEDLQRQIDEEVSARTAADEELWEALEEEISARTAADEYLQEQIDELKERTIEAEDESIVVTVSGNSTFIRVALDETV
jgi:predicted  nucleic acid-binding Zn-ribbon protein